MASLIVDEIKLDFVHGSDLYGLHEFIQGLNLKNK
jgi:hypothetical protein